MCLILINNAFSRVRVGVMDMPIFYRGNFLEHHVVVNKFEIPNNGIDDDQNGFVDDHVGYNPIENVGQQLPELPDLSQNKNFVFYLKLKYSAFEAITMVSYFDLAAKSQAFLDTIDKEEKKSIQKFENLSHGNHVAGIALKNTQAALYPISFESEKFNSTITELSEEKQIEMAMNTKFREIDLDPRLLPLLDKKLKETRQRLNRVESYLREKKIQILNMSFGGDFMSTFVGLSLSVGFQLEGFLDEKNASIQIGKMAALLLEGNRELYQEMIERSYETLFVIAAGNDSKDIELSMEDLPKVQAPNAIIVGAVNDYGEMAFFSNYGHQVDIFAPGVNIESLACDGSLMSMSGTSMATPYVTNMAITALEREPYLLPEELKPVVIDLMEQR